MGSLCLAEVFRCRLDQLKGNDMAFALEKWEIFLIGCWIGLLCGVFLITFAQEISRGESE